MTEDTLPPMMGSLVWWKDRAERYERLFLEQKDISAGFRRIIVDQEMSIREAIIREQQEIIHSLKLNKTFDKNNAGNAVPVI